MSAAVLLSFLAVTLSLSRMWHRAKLLFSVGTCYTAQGKKKNVNCFKYMEKFLERPLKGNGSDKLPLTKYIFGAVYLYDKPPDYDFTIPLKRIFFVIEIKDWVHFHGHLVSINNMYNLYTRVCLLILLSFFTNLCLCPYLPLPLCSTICLPFSKVVFLLLGLAVFMTGRERGHVGWTYLVGCTTMVVAALCVICSFGLACCQLHHVPTSQPAPTPQKITSSYTPLSQFEASGNTSSEGEN